MKEDLKKLKRRTRRRRREIQTPSDNSWIFFISGKTRKWWVVEIQRLVSKHSKPTKDPWHGRTETLRAIVDLATTVQKTFPKKGSFDGNMRMAAILSYVLALWYNRLHRAKSYDPRRPVKVRQVAYENRLGWANAMF